MGRWFAVLVRHFDSFPLVLEALWTIRVLVRLGSVMTRSGLTRVLVAGGGVIALATLVLASSVVSGARGEPRARGEPPRARLAFEHAGGIWTMAADGSDRARLTRGRPTSEPAWSPDGTTIAYTVYGPGDHSSVWAVESDGRHRRPLLSDRSFSYDSPAWSPDGTKLAANGARLTESSLTTRIVVADAAGNRLRTVLGVRVTETLDSVGAPVWLPDGHRLAYTRSTLGENGRFTADIRTVGEDGTGDALFLGQAEGGAWSPDGSRFAYGDIRDHHGETCGSDECGINAELAVVDAAGNGRRVLTDTTSNESDPSWSADGRRIAFSSARNGPELNFGQPEVYSVGVDSGCLTWLTNGSPGSATPSWAPGSGDTRPVRCGAAGRAATVEVAPGRSARRPLWLGPMLGQALLASTQDTVVSYDDCGSYQPAGCPPAFLLNESSSCSDPRRLRVELPALRRARVVGDVLIGRDDGNGALLLAGRTLVYVQVESNATAPERAALYTRVARELRRTPSRRRTPLGRPRLPTALRHLLPARQRNIVRPC